MQGTLFHRIPLQSLSAYCHSLQLEYILQQQDIVKKAQVSYADNNGTSPATLDENDFHVIISCFFVSDHDSFV
jgi:hypothetical protein